MYDVRRLSKMSLDLFLGCKKSRFYVNCLSCIHSVCVLSASQMRDLSGFITSRKKMLDCRPNLRPSWIAYAVSLYLGGDYALAANVVTRYYAHTKTSDLAEPYEEGEFLLFQNKCLEKQGLFAQGIEHLDASESTIVDKHALKIKRAEYLLRIGNFVEAKAAWLALTLAETENYRLHAGLQAAVLEVSADQCSTLLNLKRLELPSTTLLLSDEQLALLQEVYVAHPAFAKSRAVAKIRLTASRGEEFRSLLDAHCRNCLRQGVPALFHDICSLVRGLDPLQLTPTQILVTEPVDFKQHPITIIALDVVSKFIFNLKTFNSFDARVEGDDVVSDTKTVDEVPTALLWAQFLHAHLLECCGDLVGAQNVIEDCLQHTPTALDMYMKKARLLKKSGNVLEASMVMDHVRGLDLQDRYLNNKATKYFLRADNVIQAMDTIALFTKHDGDPQQTLSDLQCNWYELELAESYSRTKQWGLALKKFGAIRKHFSDYVEDMFDFHHFSIRKVCL